MIQLKCYFFQQSFISSSVLFFTCIIIKNNKEIQQVNNAQKNSKVNPADYEHVLRRADVILEQEVLEIKYKKFVNSVNCYYIKSGSIFIFIFYNSGFRLVTKFLF